MLSVAISLRGLGADVRFCAPPDCADRIAEYDVPHVAVGGSVRELVHAPVAPSPADVPKRAAELIEAHFEMLHDAGAGCDVLVTSGLVPVVASGRSIAEKLGVPSVLFGHCPIFIPSQDQRPHPLPGHPIPDDVTDPEALNQLDIDNYNSLFGDLVNAHRVATGLPPTDDVRELVWGGGVLLAADPVIAPWHGRSAYDVVQTGVPIVPDQRPLPADLESFLAAGSAPVFASFGSMRPPADFARVAIEAIRAHGRRVVLGRGWAGLDLIDHADDCFAVGEVNQQALFRRVAAVVHHGGAGTTATATMAAVPQVVVPQIADQPYFAARVAALGVGVAHDGPTPSVESLTAALGRALDPGIRSRAADVARTIRMDGAEAAARALLDVAR